MQAAYGPSKRKLYKHIERESTHAEGGGYP